VSFANPAYVAESEAEDTFPDFVAIKDDVNEQSAREDQSKADAGERENQSETYSGQREDQSKAYAEGRENPSETYAGQREDQSEAQEAQIDDQSAAYTGKRESQSAAQDEQIDGQSGGQDEHIHVDDQSEATDEGDGRPPKNSRQYDHTLLFP